MSNFQNVVLSYPLSRVYLKLIFHTCLIFKHHFGTWYPRECQLGYKCKIIPVLPYLGREFTIKYCFVVFDWNNIDGCSLYFSYDICTFKNEPCGTLGELAAIVFVKYLIRPAIKNTRSWCYDLLIPIPM